MYFKYVPFVIGMFPNTLEAAFARYAAGAGVDESRFAACYARAKTHPRTSRANEVAARLGVCVTPSFIVNGRPVEGALPLRRFPPASDQSAEAMKAFTLESPMDNLITQAYIQSTGADVAISHGWRYGTPIPPGPITAGDLWQMIPTNPELFTIELTGSEVVRMLEKSIERTFAGDTLRQQGGYLMRFAGMRAVVRLNNPAGFRVQQLEISGAPVSLSSEYVVVAAGEQSVEKRDGRKPAGVRAVDSLRSYLATHRPADMPLTQRSLVAV